MLLFILCLLVSILTILLQFLIKGEYKEKANATVITSLLHLLENKYYTPAGKWIWLIRNIIIGITIILLLARIVGYNL